ncbi:Fic family protein [Paraburkholderia sediminicola]|uniref:Fic family protein n=1 Tax=Paraburkholderia sediminicola TaxID=458836 RepID=UPI0038B9AE3B
MPTALAFLADCQRIEYRDFLEVHRLLFDALYPSWAGKDRAEVLPERAITKGSVFFCHPRDCRLAVEEGLRHGHDAQQMMERPGFIMGMFAYGHPFLDGNGRAMLLVHAELCFRAGMSIDWTKTNKLPYLTALTAEIESPNSGHLDQYLKQFVAPQIPRNQWLMTVGEMPGLDGVDQPADEAARYDDPSVTHNYREFESRRGYRLR